VSICYNRCKSVLYKSHNKDLKLTHRIEIKNKSNFVDGKATSLIHIIAEDTKLKIDNVTIVKAYNIFGDFNDNEIDILKDELFCDKVYQDSAKGFYFATQLDYDFAIEVSYKNGVTDNVGRTSTSGISHILKRKIDDKMVRSSFLYLFNGILTKNDADIIANKVLCNNLIEDYSILTKDEVKQGKVVNYILPQEKVITKPYYDTVDLNVSDEKLMEISNKGMLLEIITMIQKSLRNEKQIIYHKIQLMQNSKLLLRLGVSIANIKFLLRMLVIRMGIRPKKLSLYLKHIFKNRLRLLNKKGTIYFLFLLIMLGL